MLPARSCLLAAFIGCVLLGSACAQTCYWPDESDATDLIACDGSKTHSHCCKKKALCLDNGYCFNEDETYGNRISRGACTDQSWDNDACPTYCRGEIRDGGVTITLASDTSSGSFCCGLTFNQSTQKCDWESTSGDYSPFTLETGYVIMNRTSGSTTLSSTAILDDDGNPTCTNNSTTTTSTVTVTATPTSSSASSIGTAVGAGIGAAFAVLLVGAALIPVCLSKRRRTHEGFHKFGGDSKTSLPPPSPSPSPSLPSYPPTPKFLPVPQERRFELHPSPIGELPSSEVLELEVRR